MGFEPPKAAETARDSSHDAFGEAVVEHPRAVHPSGLTPVQSPVHTQHAEIADRFGAEEAEEVEETFEAVEAGGAIESEPAPAVVADPGPGSGCAVRGPGRGRAVGSKAKAAFTLRLDAPRHLKLRLACAVNGRSAQQLVTDALDQLLDSMPELEAMAEKAKRKG